MNANFEIIAKSGIAKGRILYFKELYSTQKWTVQNIDQLITGDIIWTENQTDGIGRLNKSWITPPNTCLTFSLLLPSFKKNDLNMLITQILAVTLGNVLESLAIDYTYKWPNDILVNRKKISGIIAKYLKDKGLLVAGIGLNVNLTEMQTESLNIEQPISSLKMITNTTYNIKELLNQFITALKKNLQKTLSTAKYNFIDQLREKDHLKNKKHIELKIGNTIVSGIYYGIDNQGRIQIKNANNQIHKYWSGELLKS